MPVDKLLDVLADHAAEVDEIAEERAAAHHERLLRLLWVPEERDPDLWEDAFEELELDPAWLDFDVGEMNSIPKEERGLEWQAVMATLISVSKWQAALDVGMVETLLRAADRHALESDLAAKAMVRGKDILEEFSEAARQGISRERVKEAKLRRDDGRRIPTP